MDQYARAWMESSAGQAYRAKMHEAEKKRINADVDYALKVDCAEFSSHLDLISDKQDFFDRLKKIQNHEDFDKEKDHEFLSQIGITVSQDILADHPSLVISKIVDRMTDYYMQDISLSDLSKPTTVDTIKYLSQYFPDETSSRFRDEYHGIRHIPNDEDRKRLKILYPIIWHETYPPYTYLGYSPDKDEQGNVIDISVSSYEGWKDALPDDARLKIVSQIFLYNNDLTKEQLNFINEEHKSLSGNYFDGKTRVKNLFNSLMTKGNFNNGADILSQDAIREIENSGISKKLFDDFLSSQDIKTIANAYTLLHHNSYNGIPFIEELKCKILENTDSEILNHLSKWNNEDAQKARANAYLYFYQKEKLNSEQMTELRSLFAYGYYSPEIKDIFYQRGDTLVNPKDLGRAIKKGVIDGADIEKLNIPSWDKERKYEALTSLVCYKEALQIEGNIKDRYLKTTTCLLNAVHIDEYIQSDSAPNINDIALVACYCKGKISGFDKLIEQAAKEIRKDQYIGYEYEPLMAELASRGEKLFSANKLISYRKRGIEVDYPENPEVYEFNEKFLCEASYHHSDGSHTTFLNEMLWYGNKEGTVLALNNDASPFTKAGFFRDKFEAMPFNMFFNRELKNNGEADLTDFMAYVATNINEDKKGVIKDIWTSLGGKLRSDPRVQKIMHDTDQIIKTRFPSIVAQRIQEAKDRIASHQQTQNNSGKQISSSDFRGPKGPNGRDDR